MGHRFFTEGQLAVLKDVPKWRFISSALPAEVEPMSHRKHDVWGAKHMHCHPHRELLVVLNGESYQNYCGKTYEVGPGTVLLFDVMEPHQAFYPSSHPPAVHLWCRFLGDQCWFSVVDVKYRGAGRNYHIRESRSYAISELGFASDQAIFPKKDLVISSDWTRQHCVSALAFLFVRLVEEGNFYPSIENHEGFQEHVVKAMVGYIEQNNGSGCHLEVLASMAGYSKYYFSRIFKLYTGMTLLECVNVARKRALKQMCAQRMPPKRIAQELGFAHVSALCRWRRKMQV